MDGLVNALSTMQQTETAYEASVLVQKKALDNMEQTGEGVLKLLESADMQGPKNTGGQTGAVIDMYG